MLEIVRGRPWRVEHTVLDSEGGPVADLSAYSVTEGGGAVICQIREKNAVRDAKGQWVHKLVAEPVVTLSGTTYSDMTLSLTRAEVNLLAIGDYLIDVLGIANDGSMESLLNPEPLRVVNRPTGTETAYNEPPAVVPDFTATFEAALAD